MSLIVPENFLHMRRVFNTNLPGNERICIALTFVTGIGQRFADIVCKMAKVDVNKRCGECTDEEIDLIVKIVESPAEYGIPDWFFNHRRTYTTNEDKHNIIGALANSLRDDVIRMQKIKCNRGLRHAWRIRVRGQHTKSTGRSGRVATLKKK